MKHSVSSRKDLTILKIEEAVFDVRHAADFRTIIEERLNNENDKNLIIDFSQVKAIDSSGISSMLMAHQQANQSEGLAIFVSLCQQMKDLLKISGLDRQLYIFTSINEVMTLIEPSGKGRKSSRKRHKNKSETPVPNEDIERIAAANFKEDDIIDDEEDAIDNDDIESDRHDENNDAEDVKTKKKRGRPKKVASNKKNTSDKRTG